MPSKPEPKVIDEQIKDRLCLACFKMFLSEWAGNRICDKCKSFWQYREYKDLVEETFLPENET